MLTSPPGNWYSSRSLDSSNGPVLCDYVRTLYACGSFPFKQAPPTCPSLLHPFLFPLLPIPLPLLSLFLIGQHLSLPLLTFPNKLYVGFVVFCGSCFIACSCSKTTPFSQKCSVSGSQPSKCCGLLIQFSMLW